MDWDQILKYSTIVANVAIFLGGFIALGEYIHNNRKRQRDRDYGTYNSLDDKYIEFLNICLQYPELDIFDVPSPHVGALSDIQCKRQLIAFTILFSIFERAFLMYHDASNKIKKEQWSGWKEYIERYAQRSNFREAWERSGETFDTTFVSYMNGVMRRIPPRINR